MSIASLGPMVVFPTDEELDRELERRRLLDEKQRSSPVLSAGIEQGGPGTATDQGAKHTAQQVVDFLKRVRSNQSSSESPTKPRPNPAPVESLEAFRLRKSQLRQRGLTAYHKQLNFEQDQAKLGLHTQRRI
ncbi:MAG: hypothetical protein IT288_03890 [Bdellovibrionales bacterium]|nr:hypothetical protein [Bdellovibrionales bacterium]